MIKNLENRILIESEDFISSRRNSTRSKMVIAGKIVLAILFFILVVFLFTRFKNFLNIIHIVIEWVGKQGSWSILLFILLFTFLSPLFMSVEIMCVGSGLIFSGVYGKALGIFCGSLFSSSRLCFRNVFMLFYFKIFNS